MVPKSTFLDVNSLSIFLYTVMTLGKMHLCCTAIILIHWVWKWWHFLLLDLILNTLFDRYLCDSFSSLTVIVMSLCTNVSDSATSLSYNCAINSSSIISSGGGSGSGSSSCYALLFLLTKKTCNLIGDGAVWLPPAAIHCCLSANSNWSLVVWDWEVCWSWVPEPTALHWLSGRQAKVSSVVIICQGTVCCVVLI